MKIVNTRDVPVSINRSPGGRFASTFRSVSVALGRVPESTDALLRHPFDVEIERIAPGDTSCPYHSHSAQWEFFAVLAGRGRVRHAEGVDEIATGDTFLFKPGEPHQLSAADDSELVYAIVADNPIGESAHYPDSDKWIVHSPERRVMRSPELDYFDGEE